MISIETIGDDGAENVWLSANFAECRLLAVQIPIEVPPFGIHLFDQFELPRAPPALDGVFAMARVERLVVSFVPNQQNDVVAARKSWRKTLLVLPDSSR